METTTRKPFEPIHLDSASAGVRRRWAQRVLSGKSPVIPVYVGGTWTLNIQRGNKRLLRVPVKGG